MTETALVRLIKEKIQDVGLVSKVIDVLLYYGFLGINTNDEDTKYIYSINYNMQLLKGLIEKSKPNISYYINPAFWPALMIK